MHHAKLRPLIGPVISFAAVAALLTGAWHARADTGRSAVAYSGSPATQTAAVTAVSISVNIVAADLPASVAISHFVVAYDSSLLRAIGATCGALTARSQCLTSTPTADIGCPPLVGRLQLRHGRATVAFDAPAPAARPPRPLTAVELLTRRRRASKVTMASGLPGSPDAIDHHATQRRARTRRWQRIYRHSGGIRYCPRRRGVAIPLDTGVRRTLRRRHRAASA